jgi:3-phosphoshikimate 1-carboxyvinyltransferase
MVNILGQLGVKIDFKDDIFVVKGVGLAGLEPPLNVLDIGDSLSNLDLLLGVLSGCSETYFFKGDDSVSNFELEFPEILKEQGINFVSRKRCSLPFVMHGDKNKTAFSSFSIEDSRLKNSLLFALLTSNKSNSLLCGDHQNDSLENLMKYFGVEFSENDIAIREGGIIKTGKKITLQGDQVFKGRKVTLPGDTTYSYFLSALTSLIPNSSLTIKDVSINQYNMAFYNCLIDMGVNISLTNKKTLCGLTKNDINISYGEIKDTTFPVNRVHRILDSYPLLVLIGCLSNATLTLQGVDVLRKSDAKTYETIKDVIVSLGIEYRESNNSLYIIGNARNFSKEVVTTEITNPLLVISLGFFGLFLEKKVFVDTKIEKRYPRLKELLQSVNVNCG